MRQPTHPAKLIHRWESWAGPCAWTQAMRRFGELGGLVRDYGGVPLSKSAVPLSFVLHRPDGSEFPDQRSRLRDIRKAVGELEASRQLCLLC